MALIATPGAADANSFITLAQAMAILDTQPGAAAFTEEPRRVQQEAWLIQATDLIARKVGWLDVPANPLALEAPLYQALPVPMVGQVDAFGRTLAEDVIPPLIQQATALYALVLAQAHVREVASADMAGLQRVKMGDIEVQISTTQPTSPVLRLPPEIWELLRPYGRVPIAGMQMSVVRG